MSYDWNHLSKLKICLFIILAGILFSLIDFIVFFYKSDVNENITNTGEWGRQGKGGVGRWEVVECD